MITHPLQKELHSRDKNGVIVCALMQKGQHTVAKCVKK